MIAAIAQLAGGFATGLAVFGVLLNNRRIRWCFPVWWVSNSLTLGLHVHAGLWTLAVRDAVFVVLAVAGWRRWGVTAGTGNREQGTGADAAAEIETLRRRLVAIAAIPYTVGRATGGGMWIDAEDANRLAALVEPFGPAEREKDPADVRPGMDP